MGGFYGSIQVRTEKHLAVVSAAETIATAAGIRCLVGPELDGWIGIYPENSGQDFRIGQAIAETLGGDVVQAVVHDDDVMVYWLWHDGDLADSYWSKPGYFNEADRPAQDPLSGDPQAFGDLLLDSGDALLDILDRARRDIPFEASRLQQFMQILGIHNGVTSYEYLKAGDVAGLLQWERFEEVPSEAVAAEQTAMRQRRQAIEQQKLELRRRWILLADVTENRLMPRATAAAGGLLVAWEGYGRAEARIEFFRPPWGESEPGEIETGGPVNSIASDAGGRRVAMALGNRAVVWESADFRPVLELVENGWAVQAALSPDASLLAYASREGVFVHDVHSGQRVTALSAHGEAAMVFDPTGNWLVSAGSALWIAKVRDTEPWRVLYPGGQAPLAPDLSKAVQREMTRVDLDALEDKWRAAMEAAVEKMAAAGPDTPAKAQLVAKMRQQMEKQLETMRANFANLKSGNLAPPREGNENILTATFDAEGKYLCCGVDRGLRIYDWSKVVAAPNDTAMPAPVISHNTAAADAPGSIYAIAEGPGGKTILFGGYTGVLCELDLTTGAVRELLKPPEGGAIVSITISADGSAIGLCTRAALGPAADPRDERAMWQIWSLQALLKQ